MLVLKLSNRVILAILATAIVISETDDPESNMISVTLPPTCPETINACDLTAATLTMLLGMLSTDWDGCFPTQMPRCRLTADDSISQYAHIDHTSSI